MAKTLIAATSKDLRAWFAENPKSIPAGAETSVQVSCKGRVSGAAIAVFNAESGMEYSEGNTPLVTLPFVKVSANGRNLRRTVDVPVAVARKHAGKHAGQRGALSHEAKVIAGQRFAKKAGLV